ncbi:MAG: hypothetical protein V7606_2000, partial [Burkholderiales bacterium]
SVDLLVPPYGTTFHMEEHENNKETM